MNIFLKKKISASGSHLLQVSFWPVISSVVGLGLTKGGVYWWHNHNSFFFFFNFLFLILIMKAWWSDVFFEKKTGNHTSLVLGLLRFGMILFITSEVMFFFSFFWAYFHCCLSPAASQGFSWPPLQFKKIMVDSFSMPLLKTLLLVSSGASITWCHGSLMHLKNSFSSASVSLLLTIMFGVIFLFLQVFEYSESLFSFNSLTYGSCFFMLTGFHGLHVTMGVLFLSVCLIQMSKKYWYKEKDLVGFECASWYWHFVDVVWLFLFIFVYLIFGNFF